jgi:hypothetical protein
MSDESSTVPMSRTKIVRVPDIRIGTSSRAFVPGATEFIGTIGIESPMRTLPDGLIKLPFDSAATTSSGLML